VFLKTRAALQSAVEALQADAARYSIVRNDERVDVRIVGVGKRSGSGLDEALAAMKE
jgi:hypothetical protein